VLGYGANPDPAGALATAIRAARDEAARDGRRFAVVASVCGTSSDPQDLVAQEARLAEVGVILAPSNARAALLAARIVAPASVAAGMHP
jgi:FdrA protein